MLLHGSSGCRILISGGSLREASEIISKQRTTAYLVRLSVRNPSSDIPATKIVARSIFSKMSRSVDESDLEDLDGISFCRRTHVRLESVSSNDVDRLFEQFRNIASEANILENADLRLWIKFDHDIHVTIWP